MSNSKTSASSIPPANGKVIRLHFACRAELPYGSLLRVTSSALWAPSSNIDEKHFSTSFQEDNHSPGSEYTNDNSNMYSSSVEMVTSPDMYPLWRTRNPVVAVVNRTEGVTLDNGSTKNSFTNDGEEEETDSVVSMGVFRHRYRYMVVTPGEGVDTLDMGDKVVKCSASIDDDANIPVMMWEDPFVDKNDENAPPRSVLDLPYRTLDIDVSSVASDNFGKILSPPSNEDQKHEFTTDGIRIDRWNDGLDYAFKPYVVHEQSLHKTRLDSALQRNKRSNGSFGKSVTSEDSSSMFESILEGTTSSNPTEKDDSMKDTLTPESDQSSLKPTKRIFLVCYHLPVIITRDPSTGDWSACWSESILAKTELCGVSKSHDAHWIGSVSNIIPITTEFERESIRKVLEPMKCIPLFVDKDVTDAFYYGMCKQVLWPVFHNIDLLDICKSGWGQREGVSNMIPSVESSVNSPAQGSEDIYGEEQLSSTESDWDQSRLDGWWTAYCIVNQIFADALAKIMEPNDTVWVHDYHLALFPKLLDTAVKNKFSVRNSSSDNGVRGSGRMIQMVFFLHIPFPTSQVFRELEHGEAILEGMLHADVVGFHAFDHARHFLNASKRILGLSYESLVGGLIGVRYRGTKILVTISNVSIETIVVESAMTLPSVTEGCQLLKEKHEGKSIIAGVDIAQRLSGLSLKLLAYERLLTDYPNWQPNVVMVQRCLIPGTRKTDEADTLNHVRNLVHRIQTAFGPHVIDYEEILGSTLPIDQRLAIWSSADVFMSTPIREALNLLPLEFVFVRKAPASPGVTITSEFSAVCSILNGALRVNPFDIQMTSTCIDKALTMSIEEKEGRRQRDIEFVSTSPSGMWTRNVLRDLKDVTLAAHAEHEMGKSALRAQVKMEGVNSAAVKLSREIERAFAPLDPDAVTTAYKSASKRVIFVDFNGTIVLKEPPGKYLKREMLGISGNKPPAEVLKALRKLCQDPKNIVYIVSGDTTKNIEDAIGNIPGLGLAAGNGGCIAHPLQEEETKREWRSIDLGVDLEAVKRVALPVLSKYTARTNGSFVKLTPSSIGWSYYSCDPEWGSMQASHLVLELERELSAFDVRFVTLKGVVEVVPRKLNKGLVVKNVLRQVINEGQDIDFILCMGDDISDEKMFTSVFSFIAETEGNRNEKRDAMMVDDAQEGKHRDNSIYAFTVAVGKKASHASYYVHSASDVATLLVDMSGTRGPMSRAMSWDKDDVSQTIFA